MFNYLPNFKLLFTKYFNTAAINLSPRLLMANVIIPFLSFSNFMPQTSNSNEEKDILLKNIYLSYCASPALSIVSSIVLITILSRDYEYGILEKNIVDGLTRKAVFFERIKIVFLFSILYSFLTLLLFGLVALGYGFSVLSISYALSTPVFLKVLLCLLLFNSIGVVLLDIFKTSKTAIVILIIYVFLEALIKQTHVIPKGIIIYFPGFISQNILHPDLHFYFAYAIGIYVFLLFLINKETIKKMEF